MLDRLVRIAEIVGDKTADPPVPGILPIGKSHFWEGVRTGKFPKPIKLSARVTCWRLSEIMAIVENWGGAK